MRCLAAVFFDTNDIDRAYKYVQQSMEDAIFANARLRTMEVSQVFPIIEKSYQSKLERPKTRLYYMLIFICLLSLFLIACIVYVYLQLKKLSKARKSLHSVNKQLHNLNIELSRHTDTFKRINS